MDRKLRIAISGGGLAGATLANALIKHSHIDVQVYESAAEFSERGASVGLAINAQSALGQIIPDAQALLERAGAVPNNSARLMVGAGPQAGTFIMDVAAENPVKAVNRAALLRELLRPLPPSCLHANKKLLSITSTGKESAEGALELIFEDGTTVHADALIGADGIFSTVRRYILGAKDPAAQPVAAGWWDCRVLVPLKTAKDKLGGQWFEEPRQYDWIGTNSFILHDVLDDGESAQCIACCVDHETCPDRKRPLTREMLENSFKDWPSESGVAWNMIELLLAEDSPVGYAQWEHHDARTYARGSACVIGDAAHAITPWQGSGAALAIEDSMVLGALLGAVRQPHQLVAAFRSYSAVRLTRTQRVAESSRVTGKLMTGQIVSVEDPQGLRSALEERWRFIHEFDLEKHRADALELLQTELN